MVSQFRNRWRIGFIGMVVFCFGSIVFALILQFKGLAPPCPLCIFQRLGVMACGVLAVLSVLYPLRGRFGLLWPILISCAALAGSGVSIRHIHIQREAVLGIGADTCGPGLNYLLQRDSVPNVISSVLTGHGDCTVIDWQFMGVTLPMLALAGFVLMAIWPWGVRVWARAASIS